MKKESWTITQVVDFFHIDKTFLCELEDEEIVCPACSDDPALRVFPPSELEKIRLAKILVEDMGVNLEGVDIILRMRQNMIDMRRQFDGILEVLAQDLRKSMNRRKPSQARSSGQHGMG